MFGKKKKKATEISVKEDSVDPVEENLVDEVPTKAVVENTVSEESTVETDKSETANDVDTTIDSIKDEDKAEQVQDEEDKEVVKEDVVEEEEQQPKEEETSIPITKSSHEEEQKGSDFQANEEPENDPIINHRSTDVEDNLLAEKSRTNRDETEQENKTTESASGDPGLFCGCF